PGHLRVLLEKHDARTRNNRAPALVGLDQAGEALEKGRLARAVAADQRQPVARADEQVDAAKLPAGALDEAEIFKSEDGCGHGLSADREGLDVSATRRSRGTPILEASSLCASAQRFAS